MSQPEPSHKILINYQQYIWYFALVYFLLTVSLYLAGLPVANMLAEIGVVALILMTIVKLAIIAEFFRKAGMRSYGIFCYLMVLILILLTGIKYII